MIRNRNGGGLAAAAERWANDIAAAAILLTRVPVPWRADWPEGTEARCQRAFPLIGTGIGLAAAAVYALAAALGLPAWPAAFLALATQIVLTGAFHEDGLADLADGFGGGRDRQQKLAIMRDSRVGSYGALALILSVGARIAVVAALNAPSSVTTALIAAGALSRATLPALPLVLMPARTDGIAATAGRPGGGVAVAAVALGIVVAVAACGIGAGLAAAAAAALAAAATAWLAERQIGGYTGDVLGATQQTTEIAVLFTLLAIA